MARGMNWAKVKTDAAISRERRLERESSEIAASFPARYPGRCATCSQAFAVGDLVASTLMNAMRKYHHERCVYGGDANETDFDLSSPDRRCRATTKSGNPCKGGAKRGELYCGPHLDQMAQQAEREQPDEPF